VATVEEECAQQAGTAETLGGHSEFAGNKLALFVCVELVGVSPKSVMILWPAFANSRCRMVFAAGLFVACA
jgi:hypothetical protein